MRALLRQAQALKMRVADDREAARSNDKSNDTRFGAGRLNRQETVYLDRNANTPYVTRGGIA